MVNDRDHHSQTAAGEIDPTVEADDTGLRVRQRGFLLTLRPFGGVIAPTRQWIENFDLPIERQRGLFDRDNHLQVGEARLQLMTGQWVGIVGSLEEEASPDLGAALQRRQVRQCHILDQAARNLPEMARPPGWIAQLLLAADSFVFARPLPGRPDGKSVVAGYPWFGDWGRDTMISLPGLTLATGRQETARDILPDYNTVDAALWFFEAWRSYVDVSGDRESLTEVLPILAEIIEWHLKGMRYSIRADPVDGLLGAGEPGVQLTWMDAKVGDWVVTPRIGKPVEVNALWYNALCIMADFAAMLGRPAAVYRELAERVRASFSRFADERIGGLYDVIDGPSGNDGAIRPNQILAVSLPTARSHPSCNRKS